MNYSEQNPSGNQSTYRRKISLAWNQIKQGCYNPKHPRYKIHGGKKMADEWINNFESFYAYVGNPPHSRMWLSRIDRNADFVPGNVFWKPVFVASQYQWQGQLLTLPEIARSTGMRTSLLRYRLYTGKTIEQAIAQPVRKFTKHLWQGEMLSLMEISKRTGINLHTLYTRITVQEMTLEQAVLTPLDTRKQHFAA
jgi:hypothetical protein